MTLRLEDIELIRRLKYSYSRALDTCDTEVLASLLTEDAAIDYRGGSYHFKLKGRDAIVAALRAAFHSRFAAQSADRFACDAEYSLAGR